MEYSTEDTVEVLNGCEFLYGLIRLYSAKYMPEVENDEDDSEGLDFFKEE